MKNNTHPTSSWIARKIGTKEKSQRIQKNISNNIRLLRLSLSSLQYWMLERSSRLMVNIIFFFSEHWSRIIADFWLLASRTTAENSNERVFSRRSICSKARRLFIFGLIEWNRIWNSDLGNSCERIKCCRRFYLIILFIALNWLKMFASSWLYAKIDPINSISICRTRIACIDVSSGFCSFVNYTKINHTTLVI